jgi:hypothetical protein
VTCSPTWTRAPSPSTWPSRRAPLSTPRWRLPR